jgi:hypothetical protein
MRVWIASALIALLTMSAYAQDMGGGNAGGGGKRHGSKNAQTSTQPAKKVDDGAYKSALKGIPNQQAPADPWGTVRSTSH